MLGLSGTRRHGRSGTARSDDREPEWRPNDGNCAAFCRRNSINRESFGFLLTPSHLCAALPSAPSPSASLNVAAASGKPPRAPPQPASGNPPLTNVTLVWREGEEEDWLRFGRPVAARIIDRRRRVESYAPGQLFALVRWASNAHGTIRSTLDIVRAVGHGEAFTTLAQVDPGGELLLSVRGWPKVRAVLRLIDAIEQAGHDPCDVAPDHWRHIGNRLACGMQPRGYDHARHRAWLRRGRLQR